MLIALHKYVKIKTSNTNFHSVNVTTIYFHSPLYIKYPENRTIIIYTIINIKLMSYEDIKIKKCRFK